MKYLFFLVTLFLFPLSIVAQEYKLGHGIKVADALKVGAYFSTEYEYKEDEEKAKIDDIAFLVYGDINHRFAYLAEFEAADFYEYDLQTKKSQDNFQFSIERLYFDYLESDYLQARLGKFITPIGYWNLEPINVLRDTTSNPLYASIMFPKFVTGINISGYTPFDESMQYHLFGQATRDLDEEYINILNDRFFGGSLAQELSSTLSAGISLGMFKTLQNKEYDFCALYAKYDAYPLKLISEGVLRYSKDLQENYSGAFYLQGSYNYSLEHMLVSRFEYIEEEEYSKRGESLFLLGYSYRPIYPVSFKIEYQWHSAEQQNKFLGSFSVIF